MLAAHDQENLIHIQQAAGASKPLNQGIRQLPPKNHGNKAPKTPFKVPLNDENGAAALGAGKLGFKTIGKGNENILTVGKKGGLGDKNTFVTPLGARTRAPLGAKTTNAKAKAFQTPAPAPSDNDLNKPQKSATARKAKPRVSHAELTKIQISGEQDEEEPEIEYMPPKVQDLPDVPDDLPELDFSIFENGGTRNCMQYYLNRKDHDGLSYLERQEQEQQKRFDAVEKLQDAQILRDFESAPLPCLHSPECPGDECKDYPEQVRQAEEKYRRTITAIEYLPKDAIVTAQAPPPASKTTIPSKGPSTSISRHAARALSQTHIPPPTKTIKSSAPPKAKLPTSLLTSRKRTPPPTNPSPMRHTALTAASRSTMGYSKGRSTSATLRKTSATIPKSTSSKSNSSWTSTQTGNEEPEERLSLDGYLRKYGVPKVGSEMYLRCWNAGCFDAEGRVIFEEERSEDEEVRERLEGLFRRDAEEDFAFDV